MKFKKFIASGTAALLMLFSTVNLNVRAYDDASYFNSLETISEEDCPDGVVPIEFENEEEFNKYCEMFENSNKVIVFDSTKPSQNNRSLYGNNFYLNKSSSPSYSGNYSATYRTVQGTVSFLSLITNFTYQKDNTYGPIPYPRYNITNAYCLATLTGCTIGMTLDSKPGISTISNNDTCTSICTCTLDQYLLINGSIKILSTDYTLYHTFRVSDAI